MNDSWEVTVSLDELPGGILLHLLSDIKETGSVDRLLAWPRQEGLI